MSCGLRLLSPSCAGPEILLFSNSICTTRENAQPSGSLSGCGYVEHQETVIRDHHDNSNHGNNGPYFTDDVRRLQFADSQYVLFNCSVKISLTVWCTMLVN